MTLTNILLAASTSLTVLSSVGIFLILTLLLVAVLLVAKHYLVKSGKVNINMNDTKDINVDAGKSLLSSLSDSGVFLSSACGGKGSCGQCRLQVFEGGG